MLTVKEFKVKVNDALLGTIFVSHGVYRDKRKTCIRYKFYVCPISNGHALHRDEIISNIDDIKRRLTAVFPNLKTYAKAKSFYPCPIYINDECINCFTIEEPL